jgi:hypothetical protein
MSDNEKERAFKREILEVCRRHGIGISHEDGHGMFLLEPYRSELAVWFWAANYDPSPAPDIYPNLPSPGLKSSAEDDK